MSFLPRQSYRLCWVSDFGGYSSSSIVTLFIILKLGYNKLHHIDIHFFTRHCKLKLSNDVEQIWVTTLCFWPPFCSIKLATCGWWVTCKAARNLRHWSSDVKRSSKAAFFLCTVLSLQTSSSCLDVNIWKLRRHSSNPKSGSIKSTRRYFSVLTADKIVVSPAHIS